MTPAQCWLVLRAHRRLIVAALLLTVSAALAVSLLTPRSYKATTSLVLNYKGSDPVTGQAMPSQLLPGYMATQIEIVGSMSVALKVVDALHLADGPLVRERFVDATDGEGSIRDWVATGLLAKLDVLPAKESSVLQISYVGYDAQTAAAVANAFATAYQQTSVRLKVEPSQRTVVYFNDQVKQLRATLDAAQQRLSKYEQEHGIVNADKALDVESVRLNELSNQAVLAQSAAMEAAARQRQASGDAAQSPDVANSPLIQNLRMGVATAEAKLAEVGGRLGPNHPLYQSARAELDKQRASLATQIGMASRAVGANAAILQQRGGDVVAALAAQKDKVLRLNRTRDELSLLSKEVDNAQRAYDTVAQRLTLTSIDAQANQADVAVLTAALPPLKPYGPKLLLNLLIGLFAGTLLGVGGAMLLELTDRRVRSAADIELGGGLVLLGTIGRAPVAGVERRGWPRLGHARDAAIAAHGA